MARKASTSGQSAKSQLKFGRQMSRSDINGSAKDQSKEQVRQKFISTNTSFIHVVSMISMGICRKITNHRLIRRRLVIYLCLVLIGGILNDFAPLLARSFMFKVQKTNVLNQWFVKIGWFWTTLLTFPLMALTSHILSDKPAFVDFDANDNNLTKLKRILSYLRTRQLLRVLINTVVWFVSTNLFLLFEDWSGSCQVPDPDKQVKSVCVSHGFKWLPGFDISGHTFLLIYSNLILIEESAVMIGWEPFGLQLFEQTKNIDTREQVRQNERQFHRYNTHSMTLRVLFVLITLLSLIWDFMLVQTSIFYHTMFQKLVAAVWAVAAWALTYRVLYRYIRIDVRAPKLDKNS